MVNTDIAARRLTRQRLWGTPLESPAAVVDWLVAVQAQDFSGSAWSIGQRLSGATETDLGDAFARGEMLRTHLLRPTWHFVRPGDIRWLLALTGPRVMALMAGPHQRLGIDSALVDRVHSTLSRELAGRAVSRPEVRDLLERDGIDTTTGGRYSHLLMRAEADGLICSGPRIGNQFSYRLLDDVVPPSSHPADADVMAAELALRFVRSRGPATPQDMASWSGLTVRTCRAAMAANRPALVDLVVDGMTYVDVAEPLDPRPDPPRAMLLSIFDETICSHRDRSAQVAAVDAARMTALGNDLTGVLTIDGIVAGTWKRAVTAAGLTVFTSPFRDLAADELAAVEAAEQRLAAYLCLPLLR